MGIDVQDLDQSGHGPVSFGKKNIRRELERE
jgi:hypothetical protein